MDRERVAIISNSSWSIFNFRKELIQNLTGLGYTVKAIAPLDAYSEKLGSFGVNFIPLTKLDPKGTNPFGDIQLSRELKRILGREAIQIAFSFTSKPNIYTGLAARKMKIRFFPTVNGLGTTVTLSPLKKLLLHKLYRRAFRNAEKVIFQNDDDAEYFKELRIVKQQSIEMMPGSGVNLQEFSIRKHADPNKGLTFLFSGRLVKEKGIQEYIEAAINLKETLPDCRCVVLGMKADNPNAISQQHLEETSTAGIIEFAGTTDNMSQFLESVDVMVLPSYYREGVPRVLLEALAKGIPIITTDFTGCRETVIEGKNGFLVQPGDSDSLLGAMQKMAGLTRDERRAMGMAGRRLAEERFDVRNVVVRYASLISREGQ